MISMISEKYHLLLHRIAHIPHMTNVHTTEQQQFSIKAIVNTHQLQQKSSP